MQARSGDELAARRAGAAAGGDERRRLCRGGEGAGLGVERVEGSKETLPTRGIEPRLTVGGESRRRGWSSAAAQMVVGARV